MEISARILLVDDHAPWRQQVHSILRVQPQLCIVAEVADGLNAVQKAQELQPDLILLDIGLPNLNGFEAAKRIHQVAPKCKNSLLNSEQRQRHRAGHLEQWGARIRAEDRCPE